MNHTQIVFRMQNSIVSRNYLLFCGDWATTQLSVCLQMAFDMWTPDETHLLDGDTW